jgi:CheY-like chemotaxis protein
VRESTHENSWPGSNGQKTQKGVRILVTDDRPEVLRLIDRSLGERYACEFASSVEEARGMLAANGAFHLALCDI